MDQPRPTRRMDMAPRQMDGFGRSRAAAPSRQPVPTRPAARPVPTRPMPASRPVTPSRQPIVPARRPAPAPVQAPRQVRPALRPAAYPRDDYDYDDYQNQPRSGRRDNMRDSGEPRMWKVVLQFVIGLAVIAAVATAVVWLWLTYYQG